MKREKTLIVIGIVCLILMIAAMVICAIKYMKEEPAWNQGAAPIVTEAPDAARLDELGQNRPPGDGVTLEQDEHAERRNL
jgi:hypothetical protein